jgi:hypothetical protein
MELINIERGFYSRTEIGEREIEGKTVHIQSAVGNKTLCDYLPPPLSPLDLITGVSWSPCTISPPLFSPRPPPPTHTPTPLGQFSTASPYLEDGL